jgi:hypothetical protein
MINKIANFKVMGLVAGLAFSLVANAENAAPDVTEDGLHKRSQSNNTLVYAKPDADLGSYHRVLLLDATVAFKKNWKRDQNRSYSFRVDNKDMERIKTELAEAFREEFTAKLNEGGYEIVTEPADDVLIVRPAIVNLNVKAPDVVTTSRSYQLVESAGEMTLYVELYDSVTSDLLAKAIDRRADRDRGMFQWQTAGSNRQAAKKIINTWADSLVTALNEAHGVAVEDDK